MHVYCAPHIWSTECDILYSVCTRKKKKRLVKYFFRNFKLHNLAANMLLYENNYVNVYPSYRNQRSPVGPSKQR
jgi:hypothetical protein